MKKVNSVSMFGVVIHVSSDRQRAIIWCEDHGPLAYARVGKKLRESQDGIAVGDCVRFSARTDGDFRIGRDVTPIALPQLSGLPEMLRTRAKRAAAPPVALDNVIYPRFTKERRYG